MKKYYKSWLLVPIIILIILPMVLLFFNGKFFDLGKDYFSGIGAGIMAGFVAVYTAVVQIRITKAEEKRNNRSELINQVKINYYILLTKINEFPVQLSETDRFKLLDTKFEERNLSKFLEIKAELKIYESNFYIASNSFMKVWVKLTKENVETNVLKQLSDIESDLHKLSSLVDPEFINDGFKTTQKLKKKIVDEMIRFSKEICTIDSNEKLLGTDLETNRKKLCDSILEYQKYKDGVNNILQPIFKEKDNVTSNIIIKYLTDNNKLNALQNINFPNSDYFGNKNIKNINNARNQLSNIARSLMKLWGLENDYRNSNLVYYWREDKGPRIIHVCRGISKKRFKDIVK